MKKYFVVFALLILCGVCAARTPAQDPNYIGYFDVGDCNQIAGWAAAKNRPNQPINVGIYVDSILATTILANGSRADSAAIGAAVGGGDNGLHAFGFTTPLGLKNGQPHSISIRFESSSTELINSPRSISCGGPAAFTIANPKITSFEIRTHGGSLAGKAALLHDNSTTTDSNLSLHVEIDQPDRVKFFRLGEIYDLDHPERELKNLPWQSYSQGMSFSYRLDTTTINQPYGTRYVFMQVNTSQNESSASTANGDGVVLAPAHLKTFTLTGAALKNFIDRAKNVGYRFTLGDSSFSDGYPCPNGTIAVPAQGPGTDYFETRVGKLFDRGERFLNPFWKMTAINLSGGNGLSVTISGPPSGRTDDPFRTVGLKRGFGYPASIRELIVGTLATQHLGEAQLLLFIDSHLPQDAPRITCVPVADSSNSSFDTSQITSIALEGPDDKQPEAAFFDPSHPIQLNPRILIRPTNIRP